MTTAAASSHLRMPWLRRAEAWLDARGKFAWIAAMVAGFIFVWPVGLALLAYMIWGKKMFGKSCRSHRDSDGRGRFSREWGAPDWGRSAAFRPSGNAAFDNYKADTLKRLEDEQEAFETFLQRLRDARDKQEFDRFMEDRAEAASRHPVPEADLSDARVIGAGADTGSDGSPRRGAY